MLLQNTHALSQFICWRANWDLILLQIKMDYVKSHACSDQLQKFFFFQADMKKSLVWILKDHMKWFHMYIEILGRKTHCPAGRLGLFIRHTDEKI